MYVRTYPHALFVFQLIEDQSDMQEKGSKAQLDEESEFVPANPFNVLTVMSIGDVHDVADVHTYHTT